MSTNFWISLWILCLQDVGKIKNTTNIGSNLNFSLTKYSREEENHNWLILRYIHHHFREKRLLAMPSRECFSTYF